MSGEYMKRDAFDETLARELLGTLAVETRFWLNN